MRPGTGSRIHLFALNLPLAVTVLRSNLSRVPIAMGSITRLAGDPAMLTDCFQIQDEQLQAKAVTDPRAAVAVDVASLRAIPALPGEWLVSGLVYDVATGLVAIVVPPAPIRTA